MPLELLRFFSRNSRNDRHPMTARSGSPTPKPAPSPVVKALLSPDWEESHKAELPSPVAVVVMVTKEPDSAVVTVTVTAAVPVAPFVMILAIGAIL